MLRLPIGSTNRSGATISSALTMDSRQKPMPDPTYEPIGLRLVNRQQTAFGQLLVFFIPDRAAEQTDRSAVPSSAPNRQVDRGPLGR